MNTKTYLNNSKFFKPNYEEALGYLVPTFLLEEELNEFGTQVKLKDRIINSHIDIANNISSVLYISSIDETLSEGLDTLFGIANHFIKQNNLCNITPDKFTSNILSRLGYSLNDFKSEDELRQFLLDSVLPLINTNSIDPAFYGVEDPSATHNYLISNLSWMYFLNTSGDVYDPSNCVADTLTTKLFNGQAVELNDGIKCLMEYVWRNNLTDYIPDTFLSSTGEYTSGTQQLDKLKTWVDIIYSPLYADRSDFTVKERFDLFINNALKEENNESAGPLSKLFKAISFLAFDINNSNEKIKSFYDIEDCPDNYLPFLANIIGWTLFGTDPKRWRLQLRNAIDIYKKVGTKDSLQKALSTVFPKDIFPIKSDLTEVWESYVPYLIYYALATESEYFKSLSSWTTTLANSMKIFVRSSTSMDTNIRLAVDRILYEIYSKFRASFDIPNSSYQFNYRGRQYPIPPFEEYPYYVNVEITEDMAYFIQDRLVCFGVSRDFAEQVREYIVNNTLGSESDTRSSGWLFFTSGHNQPPNFESIVSNLDNFSLIDYTSLWSGKSSHFKLLLDAEDFDFTKKELDDIDSGDAVVIAAKVINEFAPAHAIPLITLQLNASDSYNTYESSSLNFVDMYKNDFYFTNLETSAFLSNGSITTASPRNTLRKRSYESLINKKGLYTRTGFNMPTSFDIGIDYSGLPLGLIPSSLNYVPIPDYKNIPEVYSKCNYIDSSSVFNGYPTSSTLMCRGLEVLDSNDHYCDRGQLSEVVHLMHNIAEERRYYEASAGLLDIFGSQDVLNSKLSEFNWKHLVRSYANEISELSGAFPNDITNYYNFEFGRDLHYLYKFYCIDFNRHSLNEVFFSSTGSNIFANIFGSIIKNNTFIEFNQNYVTDSFSSTYSLTQGSDPFSITSTGAYLLESLGVNNFVNSSVLTDIDLILPSGISNTISLVNIDSSNKTSYSNDFMFDKTFIKMVKRGGVPRIRFGIKGTNFLLPNCDYQFSLKSIISNFNGLELGGGSLGIRIYTKEEDGMVWGFSTKGKWEQRTDSSLNLNYVHKFNLPTKQREAETSENLQLDCIEITINQNNQNYFLNLTEDSFSDIVVNFHTYNKKCVAGSRAYHPGKNYFNSYGNVHRKDQEYYIEIFPLNVSNEKFLLLESVNLVNSTLNKMSKPFLTKGCNNIRYNISKEELKALFKFWNDIAGKNSNDGLASRVDTIADDVMLANGGSRLDYRVDSSWYSPTKTKGLITTLRADL